MHSACDYLQNLCNHGIICVPMDNLPWSVETIKCCAEHGPYPSANLVCSFLHDEMANFIEASFWVMLPLDQVRKLGKDLCLSPLSIKDEGEKCRSRVLVDHTWFGVNKHTMMELPPKVMQFRGRLPCILWLLHHADPDKGPVFLAKFDVSDGFYHLFLEPDDALKLTVLML